MREYTDKVLIQYIHYSDDAMNNNRLMNSTSFGWLLKYALKPTSCW